MKETLGRLYLWQVAMSRVVELLELKQRVDRFCGTGRPQSITELYDQERKRLKTGLRLEGVALDSFEKEHGSLFPDIHDIHLIDELITEEIIIKLCTIFNPGWGKPGIVAGNKPGFWEPILAAVLSEAFSEEVKEKFSEVLVSAKCYRDKQGAHFDHESFNVTHGDKEVGEDGLIYSVGWTSALLAFDWAFLSNTLPVFAKALNSYIVKLQRGAGII